MLQDTTHVVDALPPADSAFTQSAERGVVTWNLRPGARLGNAKKLQVGLASLPYKTASPFFVWKSDGPISIGSDSCYAKGAQNAPSISPCAS
jgi:hypothetical protein